MERNKNISSIPITDPRAFPIIAEAFRKMIFEMEKLDREGRLPKLQNKSNFKTTAW